MAGRPTLNAVVLGASSEGGSRHRNLVRLGGGRRDGRVDNGTHLLRSPRPRGIDEAVHRRNLNAGGYGSRA